MIFSVTSFVNAPSIETVPLIFSVPSFVNVLPEFICNVCHVEILNIEVVGKVKSAVIFITFSSG